MRLKPGDKLDRYTIEALLGEGGMGVVYRAMDAKLMRRVALKVLRAANTDADTWSQAVARMLREARSAAALNHPNAVGIFDVGEIDGVPYLAMEFVEGTPLRLFIGAEIVHGSRLRWLCDVAKALSAAHQAGLIHRDIKPENVVLRADGVIKVLDFGIARGRHIGVASSPTAETLDASQSLSLTGEGKLVGTPAYMAPEQIRGDPIDERADQFSWGVLAYELLAGRLPFGFGRDSVGMLASVLTERERPLAEVPGLDAGAAAIVHKALSKDANDRFASMDEIIEELLALRAWTTDSELAPPSGPRSASGQARAGSENRQGAVSSRSPRSSRSSQRSLEGASSAMVEAPPSRRRLIAFVAAAAAAALSFAALFAWSSRRSDAPHAPAAPSSSSSSVAAPVPTPITETAPPKTQSPEALAAYREGLQAFRDAAWELAHASFERAVKLDPTFAAGYLRLAQTRRFMGTPTQTREAFQKAVQLRAALGERDQALLDALEPRLFRDKSDQPEAVRRLNAALERYPGDAELVGLLVSLEQAYTPAEKVALADRCVALDPAYADCWQAKGDALTEIHKWAEAESAYAQCLAVSALAQDCLRSRTFLFLTTGQCDRMEEDARTAVARIPQSAEPYRLLAIALYAKGSSLETVRTALKQAWLRNPEQVRDVRTWADEARLATVEGRFGEAEEAWRKIAHHGELEPAATAHTEPALELIDLYIETGRLREAGKLAGEMLEGLAAWQLPIEATVAHDPFMRFLSVRRRAGLLSSAEYEAKRGAWLRDLETRRFARNAGQEWYVAYGAVATTAEEARGALAKMPNLGDIGIQVPMLLLRLTLAKLYWLAGRGDEALPYLREIAADCGALLFPIKHIQASYELGDILGAKGDKAGACAALQAVLKQWGGAKESLTAKAAAARAKELGCGQ